MAESPFDIRSARPDELPQVASIVVAAFISDPFARFVWPSAHRYLRGVPPFIREFSGGGFERGAAYVTADFCGTALWLPPGVHPDDEALEKVIRATAQPEHLDDVLSTFEKMDQSHPQEPHWYLTVIGVDARAQGRGHGEALMRHAVARCDEDGSLAYLESTGPRGIPLYERHGFEAIGEIQVGAFPVVTPMLRRPR